MKQALQLKMGQSLTMTPQLQQAIRLLQLSSLELQHEVQEALDSNLMLEEGADEERTIDAKDNIDEPKPTDSKDENKDDRKEVEVGETTEIPAELPVDTAWEDVYDAQTYQAPTSAAGDDYDFTSHRSEAVTLSSHLLWQMEMSTLSDTDRFIATAIIDSISAAGYLQTDLPTILGALQGGEEIELDELEAVLQRIQHFDPPGIGARTLQECLLIQLKQLPTDTAYYLTAKKILSHHIQILGAQDMTLLKRKLKVEEVQITGAITLIQSLNPRPGNSIESNHAHYVTPDVYVVRTKQGWRVDLNAESSPKLRINTGYASLIRRADSGEDNTCMKNHLQEAKWFLKSLQSRNETLLKVATSIVQFQKGFFEAGDEAMKPLVLREIAEDVEMHESTISRVTSQKYMHTPKGIFEFKYFFSSHVTTNAGGECSSTAIRALLKKLIIQEPARKPLSDNKLSQLLAEQGIKVARRTIAKYREALSIPPSNERKRLI